MSTNIFLFCFVFLMKLWEGSALKFLHVTSIIPNSTCKVPWFIIKQPPLLYVSAYIVCNYDSNSSLLESSFFLADAIEDMWVEQVTGHLL